MNSNGNQLNLQSKITALSGISTKRAQLFAKLNVQTIADLLFFFPRQYDDWTDLTPLINRQDGDTVTFRAQVVKGPQVYGEYSKRRVVASVSTDDHCLVRLTWFNQPWITSALSVGDHFYFHGKLKRFGFNFDLINPYFSSPSAFSTQGLEPIYPLTEGLTQKIIRQAMRQALNCVSQLTDFVPQRLARSLNLITLIEAIERIHFPQTQQQLTASRRRLALEELLLVRLGLFLVKQERQAHTCTRSIPVTVEVKERLESLRASLPFNLTTSQVEAINDIFRDLRGEILMNRLLQGDVGSGKTLVAAFAMAYVAYSGGQSIFMAPTSILAEQHYRKFQELFNDADFEVALLTSAIQGKRRDAVIAGLRSGEIKILIGTHAVLQPDVCLSNLVLVITDEQHRFGVNQRAELNGKQNQQVHRLVMSATPIPRTLGLIMYGDLDLTVMRQLPGGRQPITTFVVNGKQLSSIYSEFRRELAEGYQAYVICPLIDDSDKIPWQSALNTAEELRQIFRDYRVEVLHGNLVPAEKDAIMQDFLSGEIHILVSTTVVEVGVDNPRASMMLIFNAECFGLAQLHQLRGRIGRGSRASRCFLVTDSKDEQALERLAVISQTDDGFALAEEDLRLRGPGQFFGTKQHGLPEFKFLSSYRDTELLEQVEQTLAYMTDNYTDLDKESSALLKRALNERYPDFLAQIIL